MFAGMYFVGNNGKDYWSIFLFSFKLDPFSAGIRLQPSEAKTNKEKKMAAASAQQSPLKLL